MKVYIGPHKMWVGPYQLADLLQYVGFSKDRCFKIGERLSKTWVNSVCQWIYDRRKQSVKIKIDRYDAWDADTTLALIAVPLLKELKRVKQSYGFVYDCDVPAELAARTKAELDDEYAKSADGCYSEERWDYIIGEMIFALSAVSSDDAEEQFWDHSAVNQDDSVEQQIEQLKCDRDGLKKHQERVQAGCVLFGKYFQNLWD